MQDRVDRTAILMKPDRTAALVKIREEDPDLFDKEVSLPSQDFIALGIALNHATTQDAT